MVKLGFLQVPYFLKSFEKTTDGPVIPLELETDHKMVLRWTGYRLKGQDLLPMFEIMKADSAQQMNEVLTHVGLPAWNYVFADVKGEIGFRVVGQMYKELEKDPFGISAETKEEFKSKELLDPGSRPHVLNPGRHYVYSANNRHWPSDSKYYGGRGYSHPFRGFRIDELLRKNSHDVESFQQIQCDRQAVDARFFVPKLLKAADIPELRGWDFKTTDASPAPALYRRLMDVLMEGWQLNEYSLYKFLDQLSEKKKSELASFYKVARAQVSGRKWSAMHRLTFTHLSRNDSWKFSPELPGFGDNHSVDPGTSKWDSDRRFYDQYSGASMRMIIVMKPEPEIYLALPGLNRNYTQTSNNLPAWKEWSACEYSKVNL